MTRETRERAPDAKAWLTAKDERVRPSHDHADGQTIPENLSYQLPSLTYIRKGRGPDGKAVNPAGGWKVASGVDLAREPRDPRLPIEQKTRCRCESAPLPGAVAAKTSTLPATVEGTRVTGGTEVVFRRIAESEFGSSDAAGLHFLARAAAAVVAARRANPNRLRR